MKYLDFSLPSGNLWYFPEQIQCISDLTNEERSRIPTKEDYKELYLNVYLEINKGGNYIFHHRSNDDCRALILKSQKYAINLAGSVLSSVKTHIPTCRFTSFGLDFTCNYWDTPCIIPQIIKKHV